MATNKKFERDFIEVANSFPKLEASWNAKLKMWLITGELDICDIKGVYWNTFNIVIAVPQNYPYCVPIVIEKSILIPRDIDWHISEEGICCLDVSHEGIIQYYREEHKLPDEPSIVLLLSHVMKKKRTERNMNCPCGSGKKVKHCHLQSIEIIKKLGEERISKDINKLKERLEY